MNWQFNTAFPVRFWPPLSPPKYDQCVIVNWLQTEVDMKAHKKMPILIRLSRWRNREVYSWLQNHKEEYFVRYHG